MFGIRAGTPGAVGGIAFGIEVVAEIAHFSRCAISAMEEQASGGRLLLEKEEGAVVPRDVEGPIEFVALEKVGPQKLAPQMETLWVFLQERLDFPDGPIDLAVPRHGRSMHSSSVKPDRLASATALADAQVCRDGFTAGGQVGWDDNWGPLW